MVSLQELAAYINELLCIEKFKDYCPNGLQVEACTHVKKILTGVTASQALIDEAAMWGADAILVHHGYFWKGEPQPLIGSKGRRIASLIKSDISLLAYHLPLDAHEMYGNNVQLAHKLNITVEGKFGRGGDVEIGLLGSFAAPMNGEQLCLHVNGATGREPVFISGDGRMIQKVAWCTGGAQGYFEAAIEAGVDAFITGEVSEQNFHQAKESGVAFVAAGHHATEEGGVQALGAHLAETFPLQVKYHDLKNTI